MQVILLSVTFLNFSILLELYALPVARYKMLQNLLQWFNDVLFRSILVAVDNNILGIARSDVSQYAVVCVLALVRG